MTKDEILQQWRTNYKSKYGIPQSRDVSDGEILEQIAIEMSQSYVDKNNMKIRSVCQKCGMIPNYIITLTD